MTRVLTLTTQTILIFLSLLMVMGCMHKKASSSLNYTIPINALTKPVLLLGCDGNSPPKCKSSKISFIKGSEQVYSGKVK